MKNDPTSNPKHGSGEKETTKRHVYIEPGVKIDLVDDLRKQYKTDQTENRTQQNKQLLWTKIAAGLLLLYTLFTAIQVKVARDTFNAANRPYVGIAGIEAIYLAVDPESGLLKTVPPAKGDRMQYTAHVKNFGPVPGTNFEETWKVFFNGKQFEATTELPHKPTTIFPTQVQDLNGTIGTAMYPDFKNGNIKLVIELTVAYDGPSGHYKECVKEQYSPDAHGFFELGPTCGT